MNSHAVRHKNWKLYVPHTYRSLNVGLGQVMVFQFHMK